MTKGRNSAMLRVVLLTAEIERLRKNNGFWDNEYIIIIIWTNINLE